MRNIVVLLTVLLTANVPLFSQKQTGNIFFCGYGENTNAAELCNLQQQNAFSSNVHAENAVDKILDPLGLPRNFVLVPCPKIENAVAVTPKKDGIRYIVYDNNFMERIDRVTSDWSSMSILAHEIGHHLCGHTLNGAVDLADQRKKELEADQFSGFVLFKIGASLKQAQATVEKISNDNDDTFSSHPNLGKRKAAIEKGYNKAKEQQPITNIDYSPSAERFFNEGKILINDKKYLEAIDKFTTVISLNPKYAFAYFNRGLSKQYLEDNWGAISDFSKGIIIDSNNAKAFTYRGNRHEDLEKYEEAIHDYDKAILIDSNYVEAYDSRGVVKADLKDYTGAISDYNKAIFIDSNYVFAYINRGIAKHELKNYKGAIDDYSRAILIDSNDAETFRNRGLVKKDLEDYTGAISDYSKAILIDSNYAEAYISRGIVKDGLKDYKGAIFDFSKAILIRRHDKAYLYYRRALAKEKIGDRKGACEDFKVSCMFGIREACNKSRKCK